MAANLNRNSRQCDVVVGIDAASILGVGRNYLITNSGCSMKAATRGELAKQPKSVGKS